MEIKRKRKGTKRKRELQIKMRAVLLALVLAAVFGIVVPTAELRVETKETGSSAELQTAEEETGETDADETAENRTTDNVSQEETTTEAAVEEVKTVTKIDAQFTNLKTELDEIIQDSDGTWSVYVKDLKTGSILCFDSRKMYAASLIKLFVMESVYREWDDIVGRSSEEEVTEMLELMIRQSDNEAYNELVRLHNQDESFLAGCLEINTYIRTNGYEDTGVYHSLSPSDTAPVSISDVKNHTSVEDCGKLLEDIYRGTNISEEASGKMLELLMGQETTYKIPEGLPAGVKCANKTGETEETEHDAAIIYGTDTDYILCVMSSGIQSEDEAVGVINSISSRVYYYLNKTASVVTEAPERENSERRRNGSPSDRR